MWWSVSRSAVVRPLALGYLLCGCAAEDPHRPPFISDQCGDDACSAPTISGGVAGNNPEVVDAPAPADVDPDGVDGQLSTTVAVALSPDLTTLASLSEAVRVIGPAADGTVAEVTVSDSERFVLDLASPPIWLRVQPESDARLLTTLQRRDTLEAEAPLLVMDRQVLADVSEALAVNPVALDPAGGHAVVHLVDGSGAPIVGAQVLSESGVVAYDIGATFSDSTPETADRGAAAIFNVSAAAEPGSDVVFVVVTPDATVSIQLPMLQGALTLANVELQ